MGYKVFTTSSPFAQTFDLCGPTEIDISVKTPCWTGQAGTIFCLLCKTVFGIVFQVTVLHAKEASSPPGTSPPAPSHQQLML